MDICERQEERDSISSASSTGYLHKTRAPTSPLLVCQLLRQFATLLKRTAAAAKDWRSSKARESLSKGARNRKRRVPLQESCLGSARLASPRLGLACRQPAAS